MYALKSHQIQQNSFDSWLQWGSGCGCVGKGFKMSFSDVLRRVRSNKKVTRITVRKSLGLGLCC